MSDAEVPPAMAVTRRVSWVLQSFLMIGEMAGQGVFALPLHLSRLGWVVGTLVCAGALVLNNVSLRILFAVHGRFPELRSQAHAADALFGGSGAAAVKVFVHVYLFSVIACFLNSLGRVVMNEMYETRVCLPIATAVSVAVVYPFAQLRSFGDITVISFLSAVALLGCLLLIMSASSHVDPEPGATMSLVPTVSFFEALSSVGGFFFASAGGQCAFFEYLTEMEVPAEYPKTLALVTPSLFALYYATAAIMYSRFGDKVPGFLLDILPFDNTRLLGNALFYFHIVVSLVIFSSALLRAYATHSVTDPSFEAKREWAVNSAVMFAAAYLVTNVCGLFEDMTAAVGAVIVSVVILIIPPAYLLAAYAASENKDVEKSSDDASSGDQKYGSGATAGEKEGANGEEKASETSSATASAKFWLKCMVVVGLVVVPLMSFGSVSKLVADSKSVSPPFSCGPCVTRECHWSEAEAAGGDEFSPRIVPEEDYGAPSVTYEHLPSGEEIIEGAEQRWREQAAELREIYPGAPPAPPGAAR
jgi:amino acid permease